MPEYFRLDTAETLAHLQTQQETGLTAAETAKRQAEHGKNSLPTDAGTNWVELIVGQFKELMVIILLVAAAISLFLGDSKDVIVIMAIVVLNAILGIYQEYQAERALAALSALQVPLVRVRRGGEIHQISAEDLVPGDIVILNEGDRVPADGRLIESVNLQIDESALTGESVPVDKRTDPLLDKDSIAVADRSNMAFMGTAVSFGRGEMAVTETGLKTELGTIAAMLLQVEQGITPLQRRLNRLGQILAIGAAIVVGVVFLAGVLRGIPAQEMFLTAISLAVAAVPEGLPALITISLSLGAARMVRRNALIRRLPAVETLGSVTIICSDKTGTLTKNEMTATRIALPGVDGEIIITGAGYTPEGKFRKPDTGTINFERDILVKRFVTAITLSTNAFLDDDDRDGQFNIVGDTTEGALLVAAQKVGWRREELERELPRRAEIPFSSERKAMTTVHEITTPDFNKLFFDTPYISITKGAPDQLIEWASHETPVDGPVRLTPERREAWLAQIETMAQQGLRVLGIAYHPLQAVPPQDDLTPEKIERDLYLLGLVGILDPARPEARDAVQTAKSAGIRSVMITGDHALTAEAIARDLGILTDGQRAITGNQLDTYSDADLVKKLKTTSVFARVSPAHKLRLVQVLQRQNEIVAMTGDGVNDAPALKQADIGVAMGITGTDVSKGAAAMVLTDDNFASIVAAIEEGRIIYDNIRKFIKYLLSSNIGEILVMFTALLAGLKIPLLAIQILWINLVTDGLPAIALGFEPAEPDVMQRKPRPKDESILAGGTGRHIIWVGILIMLLTLGGFLYGHTVNGLEPFSRTLGLENFSEADLKVLLRQESLYDLIPTNWDSLDTQARIDLILPHEAGQDPNTEEVNDGLLGAAERIPRTIAFTILAFTQMFEVMAIHAGDKAVFFRVWFKKNSLLLIAVLSTFVLQLLVIYLPFLQNTFDTSPLSSTEMILSFVLGSVVLFGVEIEKYLNRERMSKEPA
ncbi:MAG: cation-translocating P-type ATPase [Anaerolineaceae bacterium]|nr:cation-translocating P-type ATPase [Anaerolineaceae bacterium]